MHPGPMNRGVEIASEVADGPYSVILEQVANGVAVRMAVLYLLAGEAVDRQMKRLLKGGRVVDPVERPRRRVRRADRRRSHRAGRPRPAVDDGIDRRRDPDRPRRLSGADRHARAPARAGPGAQGNGRDRRRGRGRRRVHGGRVHAEHVAGQRQRRRHRVHPARRRPRRTWRASIRSAPSRADRRASSSPTSPS